jgi:hypothetical protein
MVIEMEYPEIHMKYIEKFYHECLYQQASLNDFKDCSQATSKSLGMDTALVQMFI